MAAASGVGRHRCLAGTACVCVCGCFEGGGRFRLSGWIGRIFGEDGPDLWLTVDGSGQPPIERDTQTHTIQTTAERRWGNGPVSDDMASVACLCQPTASQAPSTPRRRPLQPNWARRRGCGSIDRVLEGGSIEWHCVVERRATCKRRRRRLRACIIPNNGIG